MMEKTVTSTESHGGLGETGLQKGNGGKTYEWFKELAELAGLPSWLLRSAVMMGFRSLAPLRLFLLPFELGGPCPGLSCVACLALFMAATFLMSEPFMVFGTRDRSG
jgi:hypothetical protein